MLRYGFDLDQLGRLEASTHVVPQLHQVGLIANYPPIPGTRITSEEYPELKRSCSAVDEAEDAEIRVEL